MAAGCRGALNGVSNHRWDRFTLTAVRRVGSSTKLEGFEYSSEEELTPGGVEPDFADARTGGIPSRHLSVLTDQRNVRLSLSKDFLPHAPALKGLRHQSGTLSLKIISSQNRPWVGEIATSSLPVSDITKNIVSTICLEKFSEYWNRWVLAWVMRGGLEIQDA
ncbi:hypothetical protein RF11_10964 [Thelohanellus kitauei]|uniref:Uncharacterized protein n=1 Tax=Thelohanellus kitauei TaxID=669202 RepID=A0A0C2M136_THEKT|nr:hypothetical protein RF11_10964 [Thelohanellus kitauei]